MNVNAHQEWRAIVDAHYGSLAAFHDGRVDLYGNATYIADRPNGDNR